MHSSGTGAPLASFDIFDTVLARAVTSPDAVHLLVGNRLVSAGVIDAPASDYASARVAAERRAGAIADGRPVTIEQIFSAFVGPLGSQPDVLARAQAEEIAVEHELLRPVPGAANRIAEARRAGSVAFVSDMHLPAVELEKMLRRYELMVDEDLLVVSCEAGFSKSNEGALFALLASRDEIDPARTTHYGNHEWSDVKMARKHGFAAEHLDAANPNRYEDILEQHARSTGGLTSLLAGAAREARLTQLATTPGQSSNHATHIQTVAADVAGPVLLAFTLWALRRCREENISRVYFLTRDGELPLEIAQLLPESISSGMELAMLEVGRAAISVPSIAAGDFDRWYESGTASGSFLVQHADELDAAALLKRVGLDGTEHLELVARHVNISDGPFSEDELAQWVRTCASGEIRDAIIAESHRRLPVVLDYLQQSGVASGDRVAMIDVGWTGQHSAMLSALTEMAGGQSPLHLHIGRRGHRALLHDADIEHWLFDESTGSLPIANPVALFETFCVSLNESVIGYERHGDRVRAVRRDGHHDEALRAWGVPLMRQSILKTVELARLDGSLAPLDVDLTSVSKELLRAFWDRPTVPEAQAWGAFPFEQDQVGNAVRTLAVRYDANHLRARQAGEFYGLDWKAGSIAISSPAVRVALQAAEQIRSRIRD